MVPPVFACDRVEYIALLEALDAPALYEADQCSHRRLDIDGLGSFGITGLRWLLREHRDVVHETSLSRPFAWIRCFGELR